MPIQDTPLPIAFVTDDGLVTFVFTVRWNASGARQEPHVSAEISLRWEGASPPEPITTEIVPRQVAQLAHISDNGYTLDGTLSLQPMSSGRIAIVADVYYGDHDDHHVAGVLASFSPASD